MTEHLLLKYTGSTDIEQWKKECQELYITHQIAKLNYDRAVEIRQLYNLSMLITSLEFNPKAKDRRKELINARDESILKVEKLEKTIFTLSKSK